MSDKANVRAKSDRDVAISTIEENRRLRAALETFGQQFKATRRDPLPYLEDIGRYYRDHPEELSDD